MDSYCLRCKKPTPNKGGKVVQTKRGHYRLATHCACGAAKSRILSKAAAEKYKSGGGILDALGSIF